MAIYRRHRACGQVERASCSFPASSVGDLSGCLPGAEAHSLLAGLCPGSRCASASLVQHKEPAMQLAARQAAQAAHMTVHPYAGQARPAGAGAASAVCHYTSALPPKGQPHCLEATQGRLVSRVNADVCREFRPRPAGWAARACWHPWLAALPPPLAVRCHHLPQRWAGYGR